MKPIALLKESGTKIKEKIARALTDGKTEDVQNELHAAMDHIPVLIEMVADDSTLTPEEQKKAVADTVQDAIRAGLLLANANSPTLHATKIDEMVAEIVIRLVPATVDRMWTVFVASQQGDRRACKCACTIV